MAKVCPIDGCKAAQGMCIHDKMMLGRGVLGMLAAVSHWGLHMAWSGAARIAARPAPRRRPTLIRAGDSSMHDTFDLVVIGAGNAGLAAAGRARGAGWRVAVVESLPERPARAVFNGGGVISMEFAHMLARAGSAVTVLELGPRVRYAVRSTRRWMLFDTLSWRSAGIWNP